MKLPLLTIWFVCLGLATSATEAQQIPPVRQTYLSPICVESSKNETLAVNFSFHKDGGPREHDERQVYLLLYLQRDAAEIQKIAAAAEALENGDRDLSPFLEMMSDQRLVVTLETKGVKRLAGKAAPKKEAYHFQRDCFPCEFEVDFKDLFENLKKLDNFDEKNVMAYDECTLYQDKFGLIAFFPLNNSKFASLIPDRLREIDDIGKAYRSSAPILYFRPLPYEFQFEKYEEQLVLYID